MPSEIPRQLARKQRVRLKSRPGMEVRVYPNIVYVIEDGEDVLAMTPEQWGEMVETVGIRTLAPVEFPAEAEYEPDGSGPFGF